MKTKYIKIYIFFHSTTNRKRANNLTVKWTMDFNRQLLKMFTHTWNEKKLLLKQQSPKYVSKRNEIIPAHRNMYIHVHSSIISQEPKSGKDPSIHPLEQNGVDLHDGVFCHKKEVLTQATAWKTLANITLSEVRQTQKLIEGMISFLRNGPSRQIYPCRGWIDGC